MCYLILITIYNTKIIDSPTLNSLKKCKDFIADGKIVIWDNSFISQKEKDINNLKLILKNTQIEYIHTPENLPLSKIYNHLRTYNNKFDYIILFDQDSHFDSQLFHSHKKACQINKQYNLYLPLIIYKKNIISPAFLFYFKGFYFKKKKIGPTNSLFKTAINSGMIINFDYFTKDFKGYNEKLNFYGTDDNFMLQYQKYNKKFYILDYEINHELTYSFMNNNPKQILERYKDANNALIINYEHNFIILFILKIFLFIRGLFLSIKYKNMGFLK